MVRVNAVKELTALSRLEEAEGSYAAVEVIRVVMTGTQFQFTKSRCLPGREHHAQRVAAYA